MSDHPGGTAVETDGEPDVVVLVDDVGRATGTAPRTAVHTDRTPLHLAFSCYLFDGSELLVTRRAESKTTFPGVVTNSVCGHPRPGEDLRDAVARRAHDELGVLPDLLRLVLPAFRYRASSDGMAENELCPVLVGQTSRRLRLDPAEVSASWWVSWDQFTTDVRLGRLRVSPWCRLQVEELIPLGPDPTRWPAADPARLPAAAVWTGSTACVGPEEPPHSSWVRRQADVASGSYPRPCSSA